MLKTNTYISKFYKNGNISKDLSAFLINTHLILSQFLHKRHTASTSERTVPSRVIYVYNWKGGCRVFQGCSVQFSSVAQLCLTLSDPMNHSTPGLPVHHQLPEFTQTHVHRVSDAIQPSHPVVPFTSCPQSLPASESFPMSQLFPWGGQSTGVSALASVLPMNTQDWSLLEWTDWISLQSTGLSRVFSNATVQKHQFFSAQLSSKSN